MRWAECFVLASNLGTGQQHTDSDTMPSVPAVTEVSVSPVIDAPATCAVLSGDGGIGLC